MTPPKRSPAPAPVEKPPGIVAEALGIGLGGRRVASMGRMAAHTGQEISFEDMLNSQHVFAPDVDKFTMDSPAPVVAGSDGKYPVPMPGIKRDKEY